MKKKVLLSVLAAGLVLPAGAALAQQEGSYTANTEAPATYVSVAPVTTANYDKLSEADKAKFDQSVNAKEDLYNQGYKKLPADVKVPAGKELKTVKVTEFKVEEKTVVTTVDGKEVGKETTYALVPAGSTTYYKFVDLKDAAKPEVKPEEGKKAPKAGAKGAKAGKALPKTSAAK